MVRRYETTLTTSTGIVLTKPDDLVLIGADAGKQWTQPAHLQFFLDATFMISMPH
jgi:hypothetical protein